MIEGINMDTGGLMFGYIFPDKPELKVKEFELFRAYYCGLCKSIGTNCGQAARFALNYDSAFLGMLLSSIRGGPETIRFEKCIARPFQKKPVVGQTEIMEYASDINVMLMYYKLQDDYNDERSVKAAALMGVFGHGFRRALKRNSSKGSIIKKYLDELSSLEKSNCNVLDKAAEPFAKLTEEVFAYESICGSQDSEKLMRWFGYNIGKWIYILDAFDDIEKDIKSKSYNPILNNFGYNDEGPDLFRDKIRDNINFILVHTLSEAGKAFELMDVKKNREIIENIIYGGMYKKTMQILNKRSCGADEKPL